MCVCALVCGCRRTRVWRSEIKRKKHGHRQGRTMRGAFWEWRRCIRKTYSYFIATVETGSENHHFGVMFFLCKVKAACK